MKPDAQVQQRAKPSKDIHSACVGTADSSNQTQQGGLARSVRADDTECLSRSNVETDVAERPEALDEPQSAHAARENLLHGQRTMWMIALELLAQSRHDNSGSHQSSSTKRWLVRLNRMTPMTRTPVETTARASRGPAFGSRPFTNTMRYASTIVTIGFR